MLKGSLRRAKPWRDGTPLQNAPSADTIPMSAPTTGQEMQISTTPQPDLGPVVSQIQVMHTDPNPPAGGVFANRDFEDKLMQFAVSEVASSGRLPPDDAIRARAKELSGFEVWQVAPTPVDDPVLLTRFKTLVVDKVKAVLGDPDPGVQRA